jgi:hypothetical protein
MSGYFADVQAGLALSASWRHPEMLQAQNNRSDFPGQADGRLFPKSEERVHYPDGTIEPIVLKILGKDFRQAVVFRVGPKVRVEPAQLVCGIAANGSSQDRLIWIENRKLLQEFLGFPQSVRLGENNMATNGTRDSGDKLHNCLVWHANRIFDNSAPERFGGDLLFIGKAAIESIDQNVGVN